VPLIWARPARLHHGERRPSCNGQRPARARHGEAGNL